MGNIQSASSLGGGPSPNNDSTSQYYLGQAVQL